jgi:hypothetical protein
MNMYFRELKFYRKSAFIWIASLISVTFIFMAMFPAISDDIADLNRMLQGFPEQVKKAFGLNSLNLSTIIGYYSYVFSFIVLAAGIQAMNLGISSLSLETRDKTADFLLSKPVSRKKIVTSKLLASITILIINNVLYFTASLIIAEIFKKENFSIKALFMVSFSMFLIQLIFVSMGTLLAAVMKKIKAVLPLSLGLVFGFYVISLLAASVNDEKLKYITPFSYFNMTYIVNNSSYQLSYLLLTFTVVTVSILLSYIIYSKKDIIAA